MKRLFTKLLATILTVSLLLSPLGALADIEEVIVAAEVSESVPTVEEELAPEVESQPAPAEEAAPAAAAEPASEEEPASAEEPVSAEEPTPAAEEAAPVAEDGPSSEGEAEGKTADEVEAATVEGFDEVITADAVDAVVPEAVDAVVLEAASVDLDDASDSDDSGLSVDAQTDSAQFEMSFEAASGVYPVYSTGYGGEPGSATRLDITAYVDDQVAYQVMPGTQVEVRITKGDRVVLKELKAYYSPDVSGPPSSGTEVELTRVDDVTYTFIMPEGIVRFDPVYFVTGAYEVYNTGYGGEPGSPTSIQISAYVNDQPVYLVDVGTQVEVRITKGDRVVLKELKAYYSPDVSGPPSSGTEVELTRVDDVTYTFIMPEGIVRFDPVYFVTGAYEVYNTGYGGEPGSPTSLQINAYVNDQPVYLVDVGTQVEVRITKGDRVVLKELKAYYSPDVSGPPSSGTEVELTRVDDVTYTFIMPEGIVRFDPTYFITGAYEVYNSGYGGEPGSPTSLQINAYVNDQPAYLVDVGTQVEVRLTMGAKVVFQELRAYYSIDATGPLNSGTEVALTKVDDSTYTFIMPEGIVRFDPRFSVEGDYTITLAECENGTIVAGTYGQYGYSVVSSANEGDWITIEPHPEDGYRLGTVTVMYNGQVINQYGSSSFCMPAGDVTVSATFVSLQGDYEITFAECEHGTVNAVYQGYQVTSANEGDWININGIPDEGYRMKTVTVEYGGEVICEGGNGTGFSMPAGDITVTATFVSLQGDYGITFAECEHGTISATLQGYNVTSANEGDGIDLQLQPEYEYHPAMVSITCGGEDVPVEHYDGWYSFTMPAGPVTISVTPESVN